MNSIILSPTNAIWKIQINVIQSVRNVTAYDFTTERSNRYASFIPVVEFWRKRRLFEVTKFDEKKKKNIQDSNHHDEFGLAISVVEEASAE